MCRVLTIFLLFLAFEATCQDLVPEGYFEKDSIKVGEPVKYFLSVTYPSHMDILFPDSTYNFSPFEFESKVYFPTITDSLKSYDSAIYTFTTFEVDSIQYLSLPIFRVNEDDSSTFYTSSDSIILEHVVKQLPDTVQQLEKLPLKEDISFLEIARQFNYPYLLIGIIVITILALLTLIIFGKKLRKWWRLRKMDKDHRNFMERFNSISHSNKPLSMDQYLDLIHTWKNYMEKITHDPYTKLTTREIHKLTNDDAVLICLREIDKGLYSDKEEYLRNGNSFEPMGVFANKVYEEKVKEVRNG